MCVCVSAPRLLIISGVIWNDINSIIYYDWLSKFYSFYMASLVVIGSRCGLRIEVHCGH